MLTLSACALLLACLLLWLQFKWYFLRSSLDNIPGPPRGSILKGNMLQIHGRHSWKFLDHLTNGYGQAVRVTGLLNTRVLWVFDPKALHHIVLKDSDVYEQAEFMLTSRYMALGPGLLSTIGETHRQQRKLLNPVFSIAHMRRLTPIFYEVMTRLREGILKQLSTSSTGEVDVLEWMGRAALELIGQGGLGYSFDPLVENVPNDFADSLKRFTGVFARCTIWRLASPIFNPIIELQDRHPALKRVLRQWFWLIPDRNVQEMKEITDKMEETSWRIYNEKKRALTDNDPETKIAVEEGRDLMSVLLRANMEASEEDTLPESEVVAQISALTFAGTDTTSSALSRILHLLCTRSDVQARLRDEILEAKTSNGGRDLEYDDLVSLPYLDAICRETMRLYPPAPFGTREARKDIILPLSKPIRCIDGTYTDSIFIPAGTNVIIAHYSTNRNKAIWGPDAEEWKPERWMDGSFPRSVVDARIPGVYSNLMTFSGGGRSCIGFKFSQLEMKVALATLITSFRLSLPTGEKANIFWNRASVTWPSIGADGKKPTLPLIVEALEH